MNRPGRFPDDQVLELPGLFNSLPEAVKTYQGLLAAKALRGYDDYVVLGSMMVPSYHFFSRKPLRSVADLKGVKVRIVGPMMGAIVRELGMVPVQMPPPEIVEAMGRGTIDAATAVPAAVIDFGIDRVASYDYLVPLGYGPLSIVMNRKKFDSLPGEAQALLAKYGIDYVNGEYLRVLDPYNRDILERFKKDPKRVVTIPSAADLETLNKTYDRVVAEWLGKAERNRDALDKARAILASLRK